MKQLAILLLLLPFCLFSQSSFRAKELTVDSNVVVFDTVSIIPASLTVYYGNKLLSEADFRVDYFSATLILKNALLLHKEISIAYQVFDFNLSKPYFRKDVRLVERNSIYHINPFSSGETTKQNNWFDNSSDLNKSGSITRGISIGNRQDVVVNSDLNLQLDGAVFDDFFIKAVISDKNIPLQPEGNTQQIQEFDKVFLQLYNKSVRITAGDFDVTTPPSSFLKANKKVLGVNVDYATANPKDNSFSASMCFAMAKGKFNRNTVQPIEGNQGPYRLVSENGEANIVIIGGSERVFMNGELLQRGVNSDYVIDYNLGEIVFTSKVLISRDSRIVVEYEYTDRHYSRSIISSNNQWTHDKIKTSLNVYSEQDMKNQSIQPELSSEQKRILFNAGDKTDQMFSPSGDSLSYSSNQVRYKLVDTTVNAIFYDSVFVYSANPDSAFYGVSFTYVGENKGNYVLLNNSVNGRVYSWTAPENGVPKGVYSPIVLLVPPQKKQMVVARVDYSVNKNSELDLELAVSNFDKNSFSDLDNSNNAGGGLVLNYTNQYFFNRADSLKKEVLRSKFSCEYNSKSFSPIESVKSDEFFRRLNIQSKQPLSASMLNTSADLLYERKNKLAINYKVNYLQYDQLYQGLQQAWSLYLNSRTLDFRSDGFLTNSASDRDVSYFLKGAYLLRLKAPFLIVGAKYDHEKNWMVLPKTDSVLLNTIAFNKMELYLSNPDSAKNKFRFWSNLKQIQLPYQNRLANHSQIRETGVNVEFQGRRQSLALNSVYREVLYADNVSDKSEYAFISNVTHQARFAKGAVVLNTYYQTASGREQKKDYQYLKVAKGQGQYIWTDFNSNNIEDLDEFSIAPYQDQAEYVRIWTNSLDYVRTYANEYNQSLMLNPALLVRQKSRMNNIISLLKNQSSVFIANKTAEGPEMGVNPFVFDSNNKNTVSSSRTLRNNFTINQANPLWNLEYIYNNQYNKLFLLSGFESKSNEMNSLVFRASPYRKISNKIEVGRGEKVTASELLQNRNYQINQKYIETNLSYLQSTSLRATISYKYVEKEARIIKINNSSYFNHLNLDIQYNMPKRGLMSVKIATINVLYSEDSNTPLSLEVLEGLSNGRNFIGNLSFQTVLSKNIQFNLLYELRVSPDKSQVHTGNITIRAFF